MSEIILPLFPLNMVAFPGEKLNLHIFEPRYRQLIRECQEEGKTFVICPHFNGRNIPYGTEMNLLSIEKKYKNGKMDIRTEGVKLVKIEAFYTTIIDKLYPGAEIKYLPWDDVADTSLAKELHALVVELYQIMQIKDVKLNLPEQFKTFQVAHKVGLNFEQEIHFLKISREFDRQVFLINHINHIMPIVREMEELKKKARMNGHFKKIIPPA